jgi:general secretion pathway protein A
MYTAFYGLREKPFSLTPDPHFLYLAVPHREALAHVLYGVEQGEGFIAVTGEVGTGKTTLCRTVLQRLGSDTEVAYIFNPSLSGDELLRAINIEFGLLTEGRTRAELSDQINQFLLEMKREERRVLLIIDEAQNLRESTLEEIRLLSNLETSTAKLIQILLFGQPELDEMLDSTGLRQLRQRISVRWALSPLTAEEVSEYIRHRLHIAAGGECDLFNERALREIRRRSRGIPRLVNLLADRALLAGYATGAKTIGANLVNQAAREILKARGRRSSSKRFFRGAFAAAVLIGVTAMGVVVWRQLGVGDPTERAETAASRPAVSAPPAAKAPREAVDAEVGVEVDEAVAEPLRLGLGESG